MDVVYLTHWEQYITFFIEKNCFGGRCKRGFSYKERMKTIHFCQRRASDNIPKRKYPIRQEFPISFLLHLDKPLEM